MVGGWRDALGLEIVVPTCWAGEYVGFVVAREILLGFAGLGL